MKLDTALLVVGCVAFLLFTAWRVSPQGMMQDTVIKITPPRVAVALEFVVERDADGNVVKIHRFLLWSNGDVTFPNLPYYASLRLNCRDCPKVKSTCPEDIDGDGVVSVLDVLAVSAAMGRKCPR